MGTEDELEDLQAWSDATDPNYAFVADDVGPAVVQFVDRWCNIHGVSRQSLAGRGVDPSWFSRWKRDPVPGKKTAAPSLTSLARVAEALDLTLGELMFRAGLVDPVFVQDVFEVGGRYYVSIDRAVQYDPTISESTRHNIRALLEVPGARVAERRQPR